MGGFFGAIGKGCVGDDFFGTDYHSHLGTRRAGMAVNNGGLYRSIHDITQKTFRPQLEEFFLEHKNARSAIGVISDYEDQPMIIDSHLGTYAIVHVGRVNNTAQLVGRAKKRGNHFSNMDEGQINPVELIAYLINQGRSYEDGIEIMQGEIDGSSSLLLLTKDGIYAARDRLGRTPVIVGEKNGAMAVTMETTAFPNQGFIKSRELGPGEVVRITKNRCEQLKKPGDEMQFCTFFYIYYGYPPSGYHGRNNEVVRNNLGGALARADKLSGLEVDIVGAVPDSGTGSAIGYANESGFRYGRPLIKYTPTWPRSFMPTEQFLRDLVAQQKLIPIRELIEGLRLLFCEDSVVRGTQLKNLIKSLIKEYGAREVHMRPSCPPLTDPCLYLNFSRSRDVSELAARKAIAEINREDHRKYDIDLFRDESSRHYQRMVEKIRKKLRLTSLRYQKMEDLISAIGLPEKNLCMGCWKDCSKCRK